MRLKFITNACMIYESEGAKILSDPWLTEGIFYGSWYHDPPITTKVEDLLNVDALYISHIHEDHLDGETLKHFRKDIPIFTLKDKYSFCIKHLEKMGFTNVVGMEHREFKGFGPFQLAIFGPFAKHPTHDCEIGNVVDSALLLIAGDKRVLNTNDNMPDAEAARWLKSQCRPFDLVQLNYNPAGPYPACFNNYSHHEKLIQAERMSEELMTHMSNVAKILNARYTMPFAGQYKLGGDVEHLNQYLGLKTAHEAGAFLESNGIRPLVLDECQEFDL